MRKAASDFRGRVHKYLQDRLSEGPLHLTLIDPDKVAGGGMSPASVRDIAASLAEAGTDVFLVGGSIGVSESSVDNVISLLRPFNLPIILFPGNLTGISGSADAVLFLTLLNSDDPYFIVGAQVLAAPLILRYGLEALPTAYIIVGYGGAAGYVGRARPIPYERPELVVAHVLAAKYMGMRYAYLEAGSGAPQPIPPQVVSAAAKVKDNITLIVGGGIRRPDQARSAVSAGADAIVTGTVVEEDPRRAEEIVRAIKRR